MSIKKQTKVTDKVIFLVGPTAAGKSEIAARLAKEIGGEIICCDSMQVYKNLNILTNMPSAEQMALAPHHLFGIKKPSQIFSVAEYRKSALRRMRQIHKKGRIPLFTGGTGLYMQALLDGLFISPSRNVKLRRLLQRRAAKYGAAKLHRELKKIDPAAAKIIHPNDLRRIIRALEVYKTTGRTISELKKSETTGGIFGKYRVFIFCVYYKNRDLLYEKINSRVEQMFKKGLVHEVKKALKIKISLTAGQALGLKRVGDFLEGKCGLDKAMELVKLDTRRYAKRQLSWFRRDKRIRWIPLDGCRNLNEVVDLLS